MKTSCLLFLMIISAVCIYAKDKTDQPEFDEIVVYKKVGETELELHVFKPEGHKSGDRRPAIVLFFGGGWVGGSPSQFYGQCDYLASRGMVAFSAQYRTRNSHGTSPRECVQDGKSAIRWLRSHADELGVNPEMIAAGGGSAGGHVATAVATLEKFNEADEDVSVSCAPNALVLFNPVYDNGPEGWGHGTVKDYWREFSPLHNINAQMPATVVFLGTKDNLIPVSTAQKFQSKMRSLGIRSDLHLYEGEKHGFFNKSKYEETLIETDKFLTSLGYLQAPPTLKK